MINTLLLPRDLDDPVSYCLYTANRLSTTGGWKNSHVNIIAARAMAALVPIVAAAYSINRLTLGIYHTVAYRINPAWVNPHINGSEEIRAGLKCIIFTAISVAYAALSILLGKIIIQTMCPTLKLSDLYTRNLEVCKALAGSYTKHHVVHHNGVLVPRPPSLVGTSEMDSETMEILQETYNLAKIKGDGAIVEEAFKKISSTANPFYGWTACKGFTTRSDTLYSDAQTLSEEYETIITSRNLRLQRVYEHKTVKTFLNTKYSAATVEEVIDLYSKNNQITSRNFNAILVGIHANLTLEDIKGTESEPTDQLIDKLNTKRVISHFPNVYYADPYSIQYNRDARFLISLGQYHPQKEESNDFINYGLSEYLSRNIIYNLFRDQQVKAKLEPLSEGKPKIREGLIFHCHYKGVKTLFKIKGVYCEAGIACAHVASVGVDREKIGATVFRGTHDWEGVRRCLEYWLRHGGIGKFSFNHASPAILEDYEKHFEQQSTYLVTGHSLGAVDAQRFVHALVKENVALPTNLLLETYNGPAVEPILNKETIEHIKKKQTRLSITHTRVVGDYLQTWGKALLGDTAAESTTNITYTFRNKSVGHYFKNRFPTLHESHIYPVYLQLRSSPSC